MKYYSMMQFAAVLLGISNEFATTTLLGIT